MKKFDYVSSEELLILCKQRFIFCSERQTLVYSSTRSNNRTSARAGKVVGSPDGKMGYLRVSLLGKMKYVSHIVWFINTGKWPTLELDHIDTNPRNNEFTNLREVTSKDNQLNRTNNLPYEDRYISVSNSGKYCPGLYCPTNKKIFYFGSHTSIEVAREIRDKVETYYPDYRLAKDKYKEGIL